LLEARKTKVTAKILVEMREFGVTTGLAFLWWSRLNLS